MGRHVWIIDSALSSSSDQVRDIRWGSSSVFSSRVEIRDHIGRRAVFSSHLLAISEDKDSNVYVLSNRVFEMPSPASMFLNWPIVGWGWQSTCDMLPQTVEKLRIIAIGIVGIVTSIISSLFGDLCVAGQI